MDDKFDAIIVGAGVAGATAAYLLAKAGLEVLVIERGNSAGAKNMTGGRLYAHSLEKIIPGFAEQAPVERRVTKEKISFMTEDSAVTMDYQISFQEAHAQSYTVLRADFDRWLMEKAEDAGAQFIPGIRVDELLSRDGFICGVKAGGDELEAYSVILADGANSLLGTQLGYVKDPAPQNYAVGVKELIELPQAVIEERFNLNSGEGAAWLFAGYPSAHIFGGGFLYTNKSSLSLGVVCGLEGIEKAGKSVPQMLEDFKQHSLIAPLVKDGKMSEYSAHIVPEGGLNMLPKLTGNGVLIIGDAAGLCLNVGYTIRGMDLAISSAQAAADAVISAKKLGDFSEKALSAYKTNLENSYLMKDMALYKNLPAYMEHNSRIFNAYPQMATGIMQDIFRIDGTAEIPLRKKMMRHVKQVGLMNLIKDGIGGIRKI